MTLIGGVYKKAAGCGNIGKSTMTEDEVWRKTATTTKNAEPDY